MGRIVLSRVSRIAVQRRTPTPVVAAMLVAVVFVLRPSLV